MDSRAWPAEGAKVDFALGKTAIDRQGRRVRFDEFVRGLRSFVAKLPTPVPRHSGPSQ